MLFSLCSTMSKPYLLLPPNQSQKIHPILSLIPKFPKIHDFVKTPSLNARKSR